jgi:hypothetical protein
MQPVVTSIVSLHRTAVITPLPVQLRVAIALHKLNCVQSMSWYFKCPSYHIQIYIQSSCSYSKHTWRSECCSFSLVMAMQQQFQVMCFYILDFYNSSYQAETIIRTGWLLIKDSKLLYNIRKRKFKNSGTYYTYIKTFTFECIDKAHFVWHFQTVPHIMWIPSNWILDSLTWGLLKFEGFEGTKS